MKVSYNNIIRIIFLILAYIVIVNINAQNVSDKKEQPINNKTSLIENTVTISNDSLKKQIYKLIGEGNKYRNNSKMTDAFTAHSKAYSLAESISDTLNMVLALNNLGTDLRRSHLYTEASNYHFRALELMSDNTKYEKSKAVSLNGLGNIFLALKKYDDAFNYFNNAIVIERKLQSDLGLAINYANIGEIYYEKKNYDEALINYQKSLKLNQTISSDLGISLCLTSIGKIFILQDKVSEGIALLEQADRIILNSTDLYHKLAVKIDLGNALLDLKRYDEAYIILDQLLIDIYNINSLEIKKRIYTFQSDLYNNTEKYQLAYQAKERASLYSDSLAKINNEVVILELQSKYELNEADYKIKLLTTQNELIRKNISIQRNTFILVLAIGIIILAFMYFLLRNRRKINTELSEIQEMKNNFYSNISHEFRTPITLIKAPAESLLEHEKNPEKIKLINLIKDNSDRLLFLVDQIMSLTKANTGKFTLNVKKDNFGSFLKLIASSFWEQANNKKISYKIEVEDTGFVWVDLKIIEIIVLNLLSNAFKYTKSGGFVSFSGKRYNNQYFIRVANSYKYLQQDEINKMFERYYREKNEAESVSGTGIGLALVKELCNLYRASISTYMNDDNDIEFSVNIPINKEHFKENEILSTSNDTTSLITSKNNNIVNSNRYLLDKNYYNLKKIILIVEDNEELRGYLSFMLRKDYDIIEAENGKVALNMAIEYLPDLIISDVMMPVMNGFTLCDEIKSNYITNHIPIILVTALNEEKQLSYTPNNYANEFLTKPFNPNELSSKIRKLLANNDNIGKTFYNNFFNYIEEKNIPIENKADEEFLTNITKLIEKNVLNENLNTKFLSSNSNMTETQLERKIFAITSVSSSNFILLVKLKLAKKIQRTSKNISLSELAAKTGFKDEEELILHFEKFFKSTLQTSEI